MCGITGILSYAPEVDGIDIKVIGERMRDQLQHRGPDNAGLWLSDNNRVFIGHRRLSIIDLEPHSNQPFVSSDSRYILTFNGEIYNYLKLKLELEQKGYIFRTKSDTEVLLLAFVCWGQHCLEKLHGMFAFAIWDQKENVLFCARDRTGEKPFYFSLVDNNFIFASELKAICKWPNFRTELDYRSLLDYLSLGFIPDDRTIWSNCSKLEPGHFMEVSVDTSGRAGIRKIAQYWDFQFKPDYSIRDWSEEILDTLSECSNEMTCSDVPLGTFLSGGVDSSSVTAALCNAGNSVKTYTIGFEEEGYDERPWARLVSEKYRTQHTERIVHATDINNVFDKMLWHYDEPFGDYSYLPTYYVCREAKKHITVALSGDGGDEAFAGYLRYQRLGSIAEYRRYLPRYGFKALSALAGPALGHTNRLTHMLRQYGESSSKLLGDMLFIGAPLSLLESVTTGHALNELGNYSPQDTIARHLKTANPEKVGLINSMRYLDLKLTLAGDILVKVDRASMAVSLEVRPVFLHPRMLELAQRIPSNLLADKSHSKQALKIAAKKWLPDSLLFRKKMGFAMPLSQWFKSTGNSPFTMTDMHNSLPEIINLKQFHKLQSAHNAGSSDNTALLHNVFFLNKWLQKWCP